MVELIRTQNTALVSFVEALLKDAGIAFQVADAHGGGIFLPRRILVDREDEEAARRLLTDADLAAELRTRK